MRRVELFYVFLATLLAFPAVGATSKETKERAAKKACLMGNTEKGVEILVDLYIDTQDLTYIFNQGRCFEQNQRYEDAIGRFREYLIKGTELSRLEKADAERHITVCNSYLDKREATGVSSAAGPAPSTATGASTGGPALAPVVAAAPPTIAAPFATTASPEVGTRRLSSTSRASNGSGLRIAGLTTAAVGVAAVVAGVFLNLEGNNISRDLEKENNYSRDRDSTRKNYQTLAWVGYGVGAACILSGTVMYVVGWKQGRSSSAKRLALTPVVASDRIGGAIGGTF